MFGKIKKLTIPALLVLTLCAGGCKKSAKNTVSMDQINSDNSNNYHFIFRGIIKEQKEKETRERNPFRR